MDELNKKKVKSSLFAKNVLISLILLTVFGIVFLFYIIYRPDNDKDIAYWFQIQEIQELTSVEGKYHVVTVHEEEGNVLGIGDKYIWFEYDVKVKAGIDMNQLTIEEPAKDGVVKIHLPPTEIQGITEIEESKKNPVREVGFMTKLSVEEEDKIFEKATKKLESGDQMAEVLIEARENIKDILEDYVKGIGELVGEKYTVEWVEQEETQLTTESKKDEMGEKK